MAGRQQLFGSIFVYGSFKSFRTRLAELPVRSLNNSSSASRPCAAASSISDSVTHEFFAAFVASRSSVDLCCANDSAIKQALVDISDLFDVKGHVRQRSALEELHGFEQE